MVDDMKLKKVISNVLGVSIDIIDDNSSPNSIEKWDSLSHINLIMAIEAEFDVELTPEDSMDMLSVKLIRMVLSDILNKKSDEKKIIKIKTDNFTITPITSKNIPSEYLQWINDRETTRWISRSYDEHKYRKIDMEQLKKYVESHDNINTFLFGIYADGKIIGTHACRYNPENKTATIGVMIGDRNYWGKCVPLETRTALLDWCFEKYDAIEIYGGSVSKNFPSIYNFNRQKWTVKGISKNFRIIDGKSVDFIHYVMTRDNWYAR